MSTTFDVVLVLRLVVPLAIPRYPLPAIFGSLVIDAADQTIFQHFGGLPNDYQSYDKALDVYYLVVAYASTLRNWRDPFAFNVSRGLLYYRLIGVVLFELSGARVLLLIFPNTFEYFFIAYEVVCVRWNPMRLSRRAIIALVAGIWIFIKLPQEWWLHIAQLDVTDVMHDHHWVLPTLIGVIAVALVALWRAWRYLPAPDWSVTFDADDHRDPMPTGAPTKQSTTDLMAEVVEKVLLLGLVSVILAEVIHASATHPQIVVSVAGLVVINAAVSEVIAHRGTQWRTTVEQFLAMALINFVLVAIFVLVRHHLGVRVDGGKALVFLGMLSLMITLYDRYRTMQRAANRSTPSTSGSF